MIQKWWKEATEIEKLGVIGCFAAWGLLALCFLDAFVIKSQGIGGIFIVGFLCVGGISAAFTYSASISAKDPKVRGWLLAMAIVTALPLTFFIVGGYLSSFMDFIGGRK